MITFAETAPTRLSLDHILTHTEDGGVIIDPSGVRYRVARGILGSPWELFRFDDGEWTVLSELPRVDGASPTDVVALEDGIFAMSFTSNGYLFDSNTGELTQHFCYEPGWDPGPEPSLAPVQMTNALAFDSEGGIIYAQPRTFDPVTREDTEAFIASYDRATGADLQWWQFRDPNYRAWGMAVEPGGTLLVGESKMVYRFDFETGTLTPVLDVQLLRAPAGLAIDPIRNTLLISSAGTYEIDLEIF